MKSQEKILDIYKNYVIISSVAGFRQSLSGAKITYTVDIVQLVRASVCGTECRGFESHYPPQESRPL